MFSQNQDSAQRYQIHTVDVTGGVRTKPYVYDREIGDVIGNTYTADSLESLCTWIRNRLINTNIFLKVAVTHSRDTLHVDVKEKSRTVVYPFISLADRTFSEWWVDRQHKINRLNLFVNWSQFNIGGHGHLMKVKLSVGFDDRVDISYKIPYLNKAGKWSLNATLALQSQNIATVTTANDKLSYIDSDRSIKQTVHVATRFTYRKKFYDSWNIETGIKYWHIKDTLLYSTPNYFYRLSRTMGSPYLKFLFVHDKRDFTNYPLQGTLLKAEVEYHTNIQERKTFHYAYTRLEMSRYYKIYKRFYATNVYVVKVSVPGRIPYVLQRALGYGFVDALIGYDLFLIDGSHFAMTRNDIKYQLKTGTTRNILAKKSSKYAYIPLGLYPRYSFDIAYVRRYDISPNTLPNRLLIGQSLGLDMILMLDYLMSFDLSMTNQGVKGFYFSFSALL